MHLVVVFIGFENKSKFKNMKDQNSTLKLTYKKQTQRKIKKINNIILQQGLRRTVSLMFLHLILNVDWRIIIKLQW